MMKNKVEQMKING